MQRGILKVCSLPSFKYVDLQQHLQIGLFSSQISASFLCREVAVDEQGYIFVADSGNNRIQIFNPDGTFLRGFGRWGQGEGEFKGLEGISVNSKGNILVADRENHRVQMF